MKIAVAYDNGAIFQHFGHTKQFKLYYVLNNEITNTEILDTNGTGHGALAEFLKNYSIDALICGGIGSGAQTALTNAGIALYGGVTGNADDAVRLFINDKLNYNPDVQCSHHEHHGNGKCKEHECENHGSHCR